MTTITTEQHAAIEAFLDGRHIPKGLGSEEEACSIAAINLALTGQLTDSIPNCMSPVIGRRIITVQDAMPDERRNSAEWRRLLPLAAGTGRVHEAERLDILREWLWTTVMPYLQPGADELGFGAEWRAMCESRKTARAARAAEAAWTARAAWASAAAEAAWIAEAAEAAAWEHFDPCGVLGRMVAVTVPVPT